jgi:spermidine/putrescine transport system substrate-binding protein
MLARLQAGGGGLTALSTRLTIWCRRWWSWKLLAELDFSRIPGISQLSPRFLNPEYDPGNLHSVPISWGTTGLIYNTQKLKQAPQDWDYLWQNQTATLQTDDVA